MKLRPTRTRDLIMNRILTFMVLGLITALMFTACGDDDDDISGSYPFVGKEYVYQWTLQNTSNDYQLIIRFMSDSTMSLSCKRVSDGQLTNGYKNGSYYYDGSDITFNIGTFYTNLRGQGIKLSRARFEDEEFKKMEVLRTLEFSSNRSRTDWIDFEQQ